MKLAYVTGATGCVGRNLVKELLEKNWEVVVLHRKSSDLSRLNGCNVRFQETDLSNIKSVRDSIPNNVDAIFHVAGNTSHWAKEAKQQWVDNVLVTRNLVQIALEKKVKRFIFTSTGATIPYQGLDQRLAVKQIKNNYIRTKRLAELEVYEGIEKGLDAVILKPIIVIGAFDYNTYSQIFTDIKRNHLKIVPPGKIAFCHARDVALAHIQAFEKGKCCEHYVLGGEYTTWLDAFQKISSAVGATPPTKVTPKFILMILSYLLTISAFFTKKKPQITPDLVSLLGDAPDVTYYEKIKAKNDLGYQISTLDQMISDCHQWLTKEKLIEMPTKSFNHLKHRELNSENTLKSNL